MTATAPTAMNIGAFLSVSDLDELDTQPTREFGELIGRAGHTLVWGGSDTGLMKVVTDGVQREGGSRGSRSIFSGSGSRRTPTK